jgi:hypothetical protein
MKRFSLLFITLLLISSCSTQNQQEYVIDTQDFIGPQIIENTLSWSISEAEKKSLLQMREEEKLAHDVYQTLYNIWWKQVFLNISKSEATHTSAVKWLLERYQIPDPVKEKEWEFQSEELQKLYNSLVEKWKKSLLDALVVGATIEDLDIYDIQTQSKNIDNKDILLVYQNLERGSRNHLRSFMRQITNQGGTYTPQYISQEYFDSILNSAQERGGNGRNH